MTVNLEVFDRVFPEFCSKLIKDEDFLQECWETIAEKKRKFGEGYALIKLGKFDLNTNRFLDPDECRYELVWLDIPETYYYFQNQELAEQVLSLATNKGCPKNHEIFIFVSRADYGANSCQDSWAFRVLGIYIPNPDYLRPSKITSNQIRKRLRKMAKSTVKILVLDTSHPDFMGENLEKWVREAENLRASGNFNLMLHIKASDLHPAELGSDLRRMCATLVLEK